MEEVNQADQNQPVNPVTINTFQTISPPISSTNLPNNTSKKSNKKLLIILGCIGCLGLIILLVIFGGFITAGVLTTINPKEQITKGRDVALRSQATELVNALQRYQSSEMQLPWTGDIQEKCPTISGVSSCSGAKAVNLQSLIDSGDLKSKFFEEDVVDKLLISSSGLNIIVCFEPQSDMYLNLANKNSRGNPWTAGKKYLCYPE